MVTSEFPDRIDDLRAGLAGRYRIERQLGAGGMAIVYLARDLQHDRDVALKVIRPELGIAAGDERFHREIRLAARLVHPHILPLLDSGDTAGRQWYTMPYIEGESLRDRLRREKQLPVDESIRLTREIAEALGHAHAKGILHRDIKPENILLADGKALLVDFGIARAVGDASDRITDTGVAIGTPGYMSPEQSTGEHDIDARSDLYALASVTYEMLAGEPPFTGVTAQVVIARRLSQPPPSVRAVRPNVPEHVDAALRRALALVPADRQATTSHFAAALSASATVAPNASSRWRWAAVSSVVAIAVLGTVALQVSGRGAAPTADVAPDAGVRIAVLPFRSISRDTSDSYLADAITEEVASTLSSIGSLRVIGPASVGAYLSAQRTLREVGAAVRADALLQGDIQKAGDSVRVRVKLIDPSTEETRWSQQYDHASSDVFRIQSEVAARVASVLRIQLAERESRSLQRPPTTNPDAYDAYLRSRPRFGREALETNIALLTNAVKLDSTFSLAWARLSSYLIASVFNFGAPERRLDSADVAIRRALALDSNTAQAWIARQSLEWNAVRGWHFAEALRDIRHALALKPSLVEGHNSLGSLYLHYGFMEEAERELTTSLSLDPSDGCQDLTRCQGFSRPRVARVLWYRQMFDSALAIYDRMPFLGGFVWEKAVVLNALGRSADGLTLLDSTVTRDGEINGDRQASRALLHATLGDEAEALRQVQAATAGTGGRSHFHHAQFTIACTYARLGRKAEAVEWLRRTADNGMPNYPLFRSDPNLAGLQGDPGYEALMGELKRRFDANALLVRGKPR